MDLIKSIKEKALANPKIAVLVGGLGTIACLLLVGGSLIVNAVIYGILIVAAFGILFWKLKTSTNNVARKTSSLMLQHQLLTDAGVTAIAFMAAPAGVTGVIGTSVACLLTSVLLAIMQEKKAIIPTESVPVKLRNPRVGVFSREILDVNPT